MLFEELIKKNIFLLVFLFFLAGCGIWGNFTTYFNLYYNITHIFNDAESDILAQRTDLFSPIIPPINSATDQKLQSVIEKCSNLLQFKSESKYVDDALLILGKTFYYQQNYLKSERELQELLDTQKDSDLRLEAQLWLGKCQMKLDVTTGLQTLESVIKEASNENENEILQSALIEEIKYKVTTNDYQGAIQSSQDFLKVSNDNSIDSKVAFELGKLYELVNDEESAAKAYGEVLNYSPSYDMEFNAKTAYGIALRKAGHKQEAFNIFDDMSSQDKYKDVFDQINFQKGVTLIDLGKYNDALNVLTVVDTTYKNTQYTGAARFEIGKLYENYLNNYDSAFAYYMKAKSILIPPEYLESLNKKNEKFKKYFDLKDAVRFDKTQLAYSLNPHEFEKDSIAYVQMKDSIQQYNKSLQENSNINANQFTQNANESRRTFDPSSVLTSQQSQLINILKSRPPERPVITADSIKNKIVFAEYELGNLFITDFNNPDSAYYYYSDILSNYPNSDYKSKTLFVLGNYYLEVGDTSKADSLFNYIYDNYKNDRIVNAAANILNKPLIDFDYDPGKSIYVQAESELNKKNYYSSISQLNNIYNNYPKSQTAPKALYAEGWIFENIFNKPDSAVIFYDSLVAKYPRSEYAAKINPKLNYYHTEKQKLQKAIQDSLIANQKLKDQNVPKDSTKAIKSVLPDSVKKGLNDEKIMPPLLKESIKDSLKEKSKMSGHDSLMMQESKMKIKDEAPLGDSLINNNIKVPVDSSRIK